MLYSNEIETEVYTEWLLLHELTYKKGSETELCVNICIYTCLYDLFSKLRCGGKCLEK